ncbi:MAG: hypothetical protein JXR84_04780 [Anaerolineae bacterium]|nr:hypothetical protein [Anaerolineae bacterium]
MWSDLWHPEGSDASLTVTCQCDTYHPTTDANIDIASADRDTYTRGDTAIPDIAATNAHCAVHTFTEGFGRAANVLQRH